jgi:hypothetical protein
MENVLQGKSACDMTRRSVMTRDPRYDTPELQKLFEILHMEVRLYEPGAHPPVDLIPVLKYVPARFAPWKRICRDIKQRQRVLTHSLLRECEERVAKGQEAEDAPFMDRLVQRQEELGLTRDMAACVTLFLSATLAVLRLLSLSL